jgi:hypothetical protein
VGTAVRHTWRANRFDRFPTVENLLISLWYDHAFYRLVLPEKTVYQFLDSRVLLLEENVARSRRKERKRRLESYLLDGLRSERIRLVVVDFLESPSPENYPPVLEVIWGAWRMSGTDKNVIGAGGSPLKENLLNAKTYIIAVHLCLELDGQEEEFESLSRRLPDLRSFIREKFGVEKLPGRFGEFTGYSYKRIFKDKHSARKGQLRMPFRQIVAHPEVFGEAISGRAQEILEEHFS